MQATVAKVDTYVLMNQQSFLQSFIDADEAVRAKRFNHVHEKLQSLLNGAESPNESFQFSGKSIPDGSKGVGQSCPAAGGEENDEAKNELRMRMAVLARLTNTCPFEDVRDNCAQLLRALEAAGYEVPHAAFNSASSFMPVSLGCVSKSTVPDPDEDEDASERSQLCCERYLSEKHGRVENYFAVMCQHARYVRQFIPVHNRLFYSDSLPLNLGWRHCLAILASARYRCTYMVQLHIAELFATEKKNAAWLNGVNHLPPKLRELLELNRLLAHQPWKVSAEHMRKLLKNEEIQNRWSVSELIHAIVLMVHIHALTSFAFACGVTSEVDFAAGHTFKPPSQQSQLQSSALSSRCESPRTVVTDSVGNGHSGKAGDSSLSSARGETGSTSSLVDLPKLLRGIQIRDDTEDVQDEEDNENEEKQMNQYLSVEIPQTGSENGTLSHTCVNSNSPFSDAANGQHGSLPMTIGLRRGSMTTQTVGANETSLIFDLARFVDDEWKFSYSDFMPRGRASESHVTKYQDFPWDYAVSLIASRCDEVLSDDMANKLRDTHSLTYEYVGQQGTNIDTTLFRRAIWCYVHCLFGIRHDDFDYSSVNLLLDRSLKLYIKMAVCFPDQVRIDHYRNAKRTYRFEDSEMVHINLMLIEAKMEAALVYAFKALDQLDKPQNRAF